MTATLRSPRQIIVGRGSTPAAGKLARELGTRALVITDQVMRGQPGYHVLLKSLHDEGMEVDTFDGAVADVPLDVIARSVAAARQFDPQAVIAFGGGSVIDLAKMTALLFTHDGEAADYYGEARVPGPVTPIIAIPTTAGTGSEVTPVAVVSDPRRTLKVGVSSVHLTPEFAICDSDLTVSCPPPVTAFAGIDAVCHAVEAYTAAVRECSWQDAVSRVFVGKNDLSDEIAIRALRLLSRHLATAVELGDDLEARHAVMSGATAAGLAFAHAGTGGPHALQYPLGAATNTPHGLGVGLFLPYVLTANRPAIATELRALAGCVGLRDADPEDAFIQWVVELNARIGVPASLREIGVEKSALRQLAERTTSVGRLLQNNRGDNSADGLERVLRAAWEGNPSLLR